MTRVGIGFDAHGFGGAPPLRLGGVVVDELRGLSATSDGDVLIHAVIDAMFGAASLGDIGSHFPSTDPQWHGVASTDLLARAAGALDEAGYRVVQVDSSVIAQTVRIRPAS
jgi:2-C-methyl-D-erythritol 2,4-cyclodiphosphate synthase